MLISQVVWNKRSWDYKMARDVTEAHVTCDEAAESQMAWCSNWIWLSLFFLFIGHGYQKSFQTHTHHLASFSKAEIKPMTITYNSVFNPLAALPQFLFHWNQTEHVFSSLLILGYCFFSPFASTVHSVHPLPEEHFIAWDFLCSQVKTMKKKRKKRTKEVML